MTVPPTDLTTALRRAGATTDTHGTVRHCNTVMDRTDRRYRCGYCGQTVETVTAQHPNIVEGGDDLWTIYSWNPGDSTLNAQPDYT